jgi:hypothetical protein
LSFVRENRQEIFKLAVARAAVRRAERGNGTTVVPASPLLKVWSRSSSRTSSPTPPPPYSSWSSSRSSRRQRRPHLRPPPTMFRSSAYPRWAATLFPSPFTLSCTSAAVSFVSCRGRLVERVVCWCCSRVAPVHTHPQTCVDL